VKVITNVTELLDLYCCHGKDKQLLNIPESRFISVTQYYVVKTIYSSIFLIRAYLQ